MRPEEIKALGDLVGEAAATTTSRIHEMHAGIAERVWDSVGPAATPVKVTHDRLAGTAYSAARGLTRALVRAGAHAAGSTRPADAPSIEHTPAGRVAVGALNGAFGDTIDSLDNPLAVRMSLRSQARDVEITPEALQAAFPRATPRLTVFLHGLCETDDSWRLRSDRHVPYGFRLEAELGYTPLYVRYNSGLHVSENGRDLARLLGAIVAAWPTAVDEIALLGHSMGGLVSRSACHYGAGSEWSSKVRHVFTLGSPHRGAPLEQLTNRASAVLASLPETRSFANALNARSVGIKDLRYGYLVDEDWLGRDPDAFVRTTAREVPFLETASHYFVSATISRDPDAPAGRIVGDLLVLRPSAWAHGGRGERLRFPVDRYRHLGGATHFDLLNHPAIYEQLRRWLSEPVSRDGLSAAVAVAPEHQLLG